MLRELLRAVWGYPCLAAKGCLVWLSTCRWALLSNTGFPHMWPAKSQPKRTSSEYVYQESCISHVGWMPESFGESFRAHSRHEKKHMSCVRAFWWFEIANYYRQITYKGYVCLKVVLKATWWWPPEQTQQLCFSLCFRRQTCWHYLTCQKSKFNGFTANQCWILLIHVTMPLVCKDTTPSQMLIWYPHDVLVNVNPSHNS